MMYARRFLCFYVMLKMSLVTHLAYGQVALSSKLPAAAISQVTAERLIVVTGASGHVGISIVEELLKDTTIKVRAVSGHHADRLDQLRRRLHAAGTFDDARLETVTVDVLDQDRLVAAFEGAAAVVHLAAVICIHSCPNDLAHMRKVNLEGTRNVLAAAERAGVHSLIHYSSTHAYQHSPDRPLAADNGLVEDSTSYDATKAAAQQAVVAHAQRQSKFRYVIIAPSGVIGRHDHAETDMWPLFERHNLVRFSPIPDGGYAFVDVRQLSRLTYLALEQLLDPTRREQIHAQEFLVTGQHVTICEFVQALQEVTGAGHCLNLGCRNKPFVVPLSWLSAIAPYCERAAAAIGKKSLITSYSMGVLGSLPRGVDAREYEKVYKFFGEAAVPYSLQETFRDRYESQAYDNDADGVPEADTTPSSNDWEAVATGEDTY